MTIYCEWFAMCANTTSTATSHPIIGYVPICERCYNKVQAMSDQPVDLYDIVSEEK